MRTEKKKWHAKKKIPKKEKESRRCKKVQVLLKKEKKKRWCKCSKITCSASTRRAILLALKPGSKRNASRSSACVCVTIDIKKFSNVRAAAGTPTGASVEGGARQESAVWYACWQVCKTRPPNTVPLEKHGEGIEFAEFIATEKIQNKNRAL